MASEPLTIQKKILLGVSVLVIIGAVVSMLFYFGILGGTPKGSTNPKDNPINALPPEDQQLLNKDVEKRDQVMPKKSRGGS